MLVNDVEIDVAAKENVIQAAQRAGVEIPYYCWHPDLSVVASCRMCLVEIGDRKATGEIEMGPKLVPACQTPTKPGMVVRTNSEKVKASRATTLEYLLLNHPLDCSICDQAGECYLQDYTYKFGHAHSRLQEPKVQRIDKYHIGDQIALFTDRCVMCTRCVRFTREISGTAELHVVNRGSTEEIDVLPGHACNNKLAGNVVDLCPVGALCSKDFLYKKRVWWLKHQDSVCPRCSTGCSIHVDQTDDALFRLRPRENPAAQGRFMCDDGRFGFRYVHSADRLTTLRIGREEEVASTNSVASGQVHGNSEAPDLVSIDRWPAAISLAQQRLHDAARQRPEGVWGIFSPFMTCEEAYLLADSLKRLSPTIQLALGPVPIDGVDDAYPKGIGGKPPTPGNTKFVIHAEKCPNRRGVEVVLRHFQGKVIPWQDAHAACQSHAVDLLYAVGGYPDPWISEEQASVLAQAKFLIVQDILASPLSRHADLLLPSASFAEREGTYVNYKGLTQQIRPAIRPPGDARPDSRWLMELAGRPGLYHGPDMRAEMSAKIPYFVGIDVGGQLPAAKQEAERMTVTVIDVPKERK